MTKLLSIIAMGCLSFTLFFGCQNAEKPATAEKSVSISAETKPANAALVEGLYKAFEKGDIPSVLAGLDSNVVWNEAEGNAYADGNPYKGPDAVLNGVFGRIGQQWDGFKLVDIELHEMDNDQVLATLRYNGIYKLTGKKIDVQAAHHWKLRDGKVVSFQQYADTKQLAEALIK